jgi:pyrroline-5-carboxylate reductase
MVKKIFLAAVATLILAAATATVGSTPAFACHGCHKAAKAAGLSTMKERKAFRKECRAYYKATHKKA